MLYSYAKSDTSRLLFPLSINIFVSVQLLHSIRRSSYRTGLMAVRFRLICERERFQNIFDNTKRLLRFGSAQFIRIARYHIITAILVYEGKKQCRCFVGASYVSDSGLIQMFNIHSTQKSIFLQYLILQAATILFCSLDGRLEQKLQNENRNEALLSILIQIFLILSRRHAHDKQFALHWLEKKITWLSVKINSSIDLSFNYQ